MNSEYGIEPSPIAAQMFGNAAREHMKRYGTTKEQLAKIALKNHKHSTNNPYENHSSFYRKYLCMHSGPENLKKSRQKKLREIK